MKHNKLKPSYYVAEAPATQNPLEDSRYVVFRWTTAEQQLVDRVRRHIRSLQRGGLCVTIRASPGPTAQFFSTLPAWTDGIKGLQASVDTGLPIQISQADGERLIATDKGVSHIDCLHLTVTDDDIYVGAYGKHTGTHYETRNLTQEDL